MGVAGLQQRGLVARADSQTAPVGNGRRAFGHETPRRGLRVDRGHAPPHHIFGIPCPRSACRPPAPGGGQQRRLLRPDRSRHGSPIDQPEDHAQRTEIVRRGRDSGQRGEGILARAAPAGRVEGFGLRRRRRRLYQRSADRRGGAGLTPPRPARHQQETAQGPDRGYERTVLLRSHRPHGHRADDPGPVLSTRLGDAGGSRRPVQRREIHGRHPRRGHGHGRGGSAAGG